MIIFQLKYFTLCPQKYHSWSDLKNVYMRYNNRPVSTYENTACRRGLEDRNKGNWLTLYSFLLYVFNLSLASILIYLKWPILCINHLRLNGNTSEHSRVDFTDKSRPCPIYFPIPLYLNFSPKVPVPQLFSIEQTNFPKAQFRRRTFHEPNLIPWIKHMKSSASEWVKNGYLNLERLNRSFRLAQPGISPLERLWFRRRTFHVPNRIHKLL